MKIDEVLAIAERACAHSRHKSTQWCADETVHQELRAAILALISEREDAEAEACAEVCEEQGREWDSDAQQTHKNYAAFSAQAIRARIAARKGGAKP
jgi:formate-dependent phosphoribosylglycinamide formyltransferase (GAR transformylase)